MGRWSALRRALIARDPDRIRAMFDRIMPRYDLMNSLMTLGLDGRWRRMAAAQARLAGGDRVLDACCGTGDLAFTLGAMYPDCAVVGLDFSAKMLARAREKAGDRRRGGASVLPEFIRGDLLDLPFADHEFAAVTVGWGVRNVSQVGRAFAELARVTRPGGRVVCLESTRTQGEPGGRLHRLWMRGVVPALGRVVTGENEAYAYLPASVEAFPSAEELAAIMARVGLTNVRYRRVGLGGVAIHVGEVAAPAGVGGS